MSSREEFGVGEAGEPRRAHHLAFDEALDQAVEDWAGRRADPTPPGETVELKMTLVVKVSKTNPGRIEGYVVNLSGGD